MPAKRGRTISNMGFHLFAGPSGGVSFITPPPIEAVDIEFEMSQREIDLRSRKREVDLEAEERKIDFHLN